MKYKLTNKTNIPLDDIHTAILFVAPKGITNFTVTVNPTDKHIWNAYSYPFKPTPSVKFYFQEEDIMFPQMSNTRAAKVAGYSPICLLKNRYELLIYLFAHELRHIWQATVSKRNFNIQKIGKYIDENGSEQFTRYHMERDACQYAKKMLERYRKL